jgi:hypothetical protein
VHMYIIHWSRDRFTDFHKFPGIKRSYFASDFFGALSLSLLKGNYINN